MLTERPIVRGRIVASTFAALFFCTAVALVGCSTGAPCKQVTEDRAAQSPDGGLVHVGADAQPDDATCAAACPDAVACFRASDADFVTCTVTRPICPD